MDGLDKTVLQFWALFSAFLLLVLLMLPWIFGFFELYFSWVKGVLNL